MREEFERAEPGACRFAVIRRTDHTGVSGAGHVADGVRFADGSVAIRWRGAHPTTTVYASMSSVRAIHGHGGSTTFDWLDGARSVGAEHASLDDMENAPCGSVGLHVGADVRNALPPERWQAPDYVPAAKQALYLEGYADAVGVVPLNAWL